MKLLFILTFKCSLEKWKHEGILVRELEFCFEYLKKDYFEGIQLFTYGVNDQAILDELDIDQSLKDRIELIAPDTQPKSIIDYLMHAFNYKKIKSAVDSGAEICRTNQINGCWVGWVSKLCGAKYFLRCGYIFSRRLFKNKKYFSAFVALIVEIISFNLADLCSVTTQDAKDYISKYLINRKKAFVAPTYVNTEIFKADIDQKPKSDSIVYVGRVQEQKNVMAMIEAVSKTGKSLVVVGSGPQEEALQARAEELDLPLEYHARMNNSDINNLFKQHRFFILPSFHEGLPKVMIEAMSSEMICIGTPTSGTTALIFDEKTGYLSKDFSVDSLVEAIESAFNDAHNITYAKNARQFIIDNHTIEIYVEREFKHIQKAL